MSLLEGKMKKITIHRHNYKRKKRNFLNHEVHYETHPDLASHTDLADHLQALDDDEDLRIEQDPIKIEMPHKTQRDVPADDGLEEAIKEKPVKKVKKRRKHIDKKVLKWAILLLSLLLLLLLLSLIPWSKLVAPKHDERQPVELTKVEKAIEKTKDSVVSVTNIQRAKDLLNDVGATREPEEVGIGSGVIYKLDDTYAYIITNEHVVKGAKTIEVTTTKNEKLIAKKLGGDAWSDIAVIRVPVGQSMNTMPLSKDKNLRLGQTTIAIGSPLGKTFAGSVSQGIISGTNRQVPVDLNGDGTYDWEMNVLQTDAAINPGNSGGALINDNGELIGINTLKITLQNVEGLGFAIPTDEALRIARLLEKDGNIKRPTLGVAAEDLHNLFLTAVQDEVNLPADVKNGVVLMEIEPNSPADASGLQTKDVVTQIDDTPIDSAVIFRKVLFYDKKKGDTITITYYRNGQKESVEVTLT